MNESISKNSSFLAVILVNDCWLWDNDACCEDFDKLKWGISQLRDQLSLILDTLTVYILGSFQAVCCDDHLHCCPHGKVCNLEAETCDDPLGFLPSVRWVEKESALTSQTKDEKCDKQTMCPGGTTCCKKDSGQWACCPLPQVSSFITRNPFLFFLFKATVCFSWSPAATSSWRESVRNEIGEHHFGRFLSAMLVVLIQAPPAADIPYCVSNSGKHVWMISSWKRFFFPVPLILLT